jgi:hypothetical protein
MGDSRETRSALARAEGNLAGLDGAALASSAFGYSESQLRFHEGSAYTHLRETRAALPAQERALELCAPGDYTDWALTRLDRSVCLAYDGDISGALAYAADTIQALTGPQRQGIITARGYELLGTLPAAERASVPACDFRDLLMLTTGVKEITPP